MEPDQKEEKQLKSQKSILTVLHKVNSLHKSNQISKNQLKTMIEIDEPPKRKSENDIHLLSPKSVNLIENDWKDKVNNIDSPLFSHDKDNKDNKDNKDSNIIGKHRNSKFIDDRLGVNEFLKNEFTSTIKTITSPNKEEINKGSNVKKINIANDNGNSHYNYNNNHNLYNKKQVIYVNKAKKKESNFSSDWNKGNIKGNPNTKGKSNDSIVNSKRNNIKSMNFDCFNKDDNIRYDILNENDLSVMNISGNNDYLSILKEIEDIFGEDLSSFDEKCK